MKHIDSVRAGINNEIASHLQAVSKLRLVIRALDSLKEDPPEKKMVKPRLGFTKKGTPRKRIRHVRIKTTCKMCGRTFIAQRAPGGKRPVLFCHKPCNTERYRAAQRKKEQQYKEKGVPILKGDPLTPAHPSH